MNFKEAYIAGQKGANEGLPMGGGLKSIAQVINDIQRGRIYSIAAAPKGGKSTFADVGFCIEPALFVIETNLAIKKELERISAVLLTTQDFTMRTLLNKEYEQNNSRLIEAEWIYFSFEIDRISKEFDFVAHFLNRDFGIYKIMLPLGKTYRGENFVVLSSSYLRGELHYDSEDKKKKKEMIKVDPFVEEKIIWVYENRIVPLFGRYDDKGIKLSKGVIKFIESKDNPTGLRNYLIAYAKQHGEFIYSHAEKDGKTFSRMIGYKPRNPKKYTIVITDHLRKLIPERNFKMKETVDKFSEYAVEFRNTCNFTFVHIIHLNRSMGETSRRRLDDDKIFPQSDDIKETGNLSEDSNYIFTMFNPNDDKFNLRQHFGTTIRHKDFSLMYPNMRTIHLVESRHCFCPQHFRVNMFGEIKKFEPLII